MRWLYERTADNSARFVLGTVGANPLICMGLNPSTAAPDKLDDTVTRVQKVASSNGYDSFIMLNVYPKRDTIPDHLPADFDSTLNAENQRWIALTIAGRPLPIYAAWGGIIAKRPYLAALLRDILDLPELGEAQWLTRGRLTGGEHPRHPLYVAYQDPFQPFDIGAYQPVLDKMMGSTSENN